MYGIGHKWCKNFEGVFDPLFLPIVFTDHLITKSEFYGPLSSFQIRISLIDAPYPFDHNDWVILDTKVENMMKNYMESAGLEPAAIKISITLSKQNYQKIFDKSKLLCLIKVLHKAELLSDW